jgi:polysaccharide export outer membrane protein
MSKCGSLTKNKPNQPAMKKILPIFIATTLIGKLGCTFLPSSGPSAFRMKLDSGRKWVQPEYRVLQLDQSTAEAVRQNSPRPVYMAADGRPTELLFMKRVIEGLGAGHSQGIRAGDTLRVSVYETVGGLFSPLATAVGGAGAPLTVLPEQKVDSTGAISVPYVGRLQANGKLQSEIEKEIAARLSEKMVDPQVIVTITSRKGGNLVTVGGDVKVPNLVPVSLAGTRLLDDIMTLLGISLGAVSQELKVLRSVGAVKSVYMPGDRWDHYLVDLELSKFATAKERLERLKPSLERGESMLPSLLRILVK